MRFRLRPLALPKRRPAQVGQCRMPRCPTRHGPSRPAPAQRVSRPHQPRPPSTGITLVPSRPRPYISSTGVALADSRPPTSVTSVQSHPPPSSATRVPPAELALPTSASAPHALPSEPTAGTTHVSAPWEDCVRVPFSVPPTGYLDEAPSGISDGSLEDGSAFDVRLVIVFFSFKIVSYFQIYLYGDSQYLSIYLILMLCFTQFTLRELPSGTASSLAVLTSMGFEDRDRCLALLKRFNGDLARVINALCP